jgi:hypothetical protein
MKDNRNNKAKIYMIFSLVVLAIVVIVSGTYAYYVWTTSDSDTTKIVAGIGAATVTFDGGSDISANLRPVSDKSKGIIKNISVKGDTEGLVFNMYLDITSIDTDLKDESFRYELYKGDTKVKEGNFSDSYLTSNTVTCSKNNTNHIVLLTNESISMSKTQYTLYIWIDGANYTNPNTMMNKTFSFKLHADGEGAVLKPILGNAVEYITNLYTNAAKETVTNNSITYNTAPSVSLMNDRLGGTTTDLDGGNIRYYGANPNNYMLFNCSDYSINTIYVWQDSYNNDGNLFTSEKECLNQVEDEIRNEVSSITCSSDWENAGFESEAACNETLTEENIKQIIKEEQQRMCSNKVTIGPTGCERWRIIGVFNGKLKIVRNESIGKYSWDNKNTSTGAESSYGKNDWTTARLMKLLNPSDYYTVDSNDNNLGQSLYYNSVSGKCYSGQNNATVDCDFTSKGIKDNKTKNMIAETIWNLGTYNNMLVNFLPNQIYGYERGTTVYAGRPTIWRGKIGLMYLSDYGYAVDFNNCNKVPNNYDLMCANNVWLFNKSSNQFCINNESQNSDYVAFKYSSSYNFSFGSSSTSADIYPVLYLNSDIRLESGDGSKNNAYKLSA